METASNKGQLAIWAGISVEGVCLAACDGRVVFVMDCRKFGINN